MGPRLTATARRESILRSATALFARRGFAGVTTRALAASAGISEAMLYKHFPRKEALYRAILERHLGEMERTMPLAGLEASEAPPDEFLGTIAGTILRRMDSDPTLLRLMFFSALEGHSLAREFDRARGRGLREAITGYLGRRMGEGSLRRTDPAVAARAFMWMVVGFGLSRVLFREPGARSVPREELVPLLVDTFLGGLRAPARRRGGKP